MEQGLQTLTARSCSPATSPASAAWDSSEQPISSFTSSHRHGGEWDLLLYSSHGHGGEWDLLLCSSHGHDGEWDLLLYLFPWTQGTVANPTYLCPPSPSRRKGHCSKDVTSGSNTSVSGTQRGTSPGCLLPSLTDLCPIVEKHDLKSPEPQSMFWAVVQNHRTKAGRDF